MRVQNLSDFRAALVDDSVFFVECFNLPSHDMNVKIHRNLNIRLVNKVDEALKGPLLAGLHWTLHKTHGESVRTASKPLVVFLHGWLGSETDWLPFVNTLLEKASVPSSSILTVSTDCELLSPTLFCHALRELIYLNLLSSNRQFPNDSMQLIIIGYSQGGRLGMHYRHHFPHDVQKLICVSTVSGKPHDSTSEFERSVIDMWTASKSAHDLIGFGDSTEEFLNKWYSLPVFSNFKKRLPSIYSKLISKRINGSLDVDLALRNMVRTSLTVDANADLVIVGNLDSKYASLAHSAKESQAVAEAVFIKNCGHCLLSEKPDGLNSILTDFLLSRSPDPLIPSGIDYIRNESTVEEWNLAVCKISVSQIDIRLQAPLTVLSNGTSHIFPNRRGLRILLTVCKVDEKSSFKESKHFAGVGEVYEPVFALNCAESDENEEQLTYNDIVEEIFALSSGIEQWEGKVFSSAAGVADAVSSALSPLRSRCSSVSLYGFEQCMLHALAQFTRVSLVDAIGAYIKCPRKRRSHIQINGFASLREDKKASAIATSLYRTVKLKVGNVDGSNAKQDAKNVNTFVEGTLNKGKGWLRLDANQSWTVEQAKLFLEGLSPKAIIAIDYIEEPLRFDSEDNDWARLFAAHPLPPTAEPLSPHRWSEVSIALDESLCLPRLISEGIVKQLPSNARFVIKPSLLSLSSEYLRINSERSPDNLRRESVDDNVTISCTFECGGGLAFLACIAAWYGDTAHGIHARLDMAEVDIFTKEFMNLLQPSSQGGGMEIAVWRAEKLLNDLALSYSNI